MIAVGDAQRIDEQADDLPFGLYGGQLAGHLEHDAQLLVSAEQFVGHAGVFVEHHAQLLAKAGEHPIHRGHVRRAPGRRRAERVAQRLQQRIQFGMADRVHAFAVSLLAANFCSISTLSRDGENGLACKVTSMPANFSWMLSWSQRALSMVMGIFSCASRRSHWTSSIPSQMGMFASVTRQSIPPRREELLGFLAIAGFHDLVATLAQPDGHQAHHVDVVFSHQYSCHLESPSVKRPQLPRSWLRRARRAASM
jgi:hypothetical protein